jgi:hypothetical protein
MCDYGGELIRMEEKIREKETETEEGREGMIISTKCS